MYVCNTVERLLDLRTSGEGKYETSEVGGGKQGMLASSKLLISYSNLKSCRCRRRRETFFSQEVLELKNSSI